MRVVSLLPSATEIVCALGHRADLVGRSEECDFPPEVRRLPVVMRARADGSQSSSTAIDRRVRAARSKGESLYTLDIPRIRSLRPDLLLTQDLCGVCSVTDREVIAACEEAGVRPSIVSLSPRTLAEVWTSVERVGEALGDAGSGRELAGRLRSRTKRSASNSSRVAVVEWLDPPFVAGLWTPDIVAAAGATAIGTAAGAPGTRTTWSEIARQAPDLVVVSPCSFSVERTRRELAAESLAGQVASVQAPLGVFLADEAYFSRPGPRLAEGVDLLRHLLGARVAIPSLPVARWSERSAEVAG